MSGGSVAMTARCAGAVPHADAMWLGSEATPGGGTTWTSIQCVACGDRPWTVAAQAARTRRDTPPAPSLPSLRPVLNTASDVARAWYSRFTRRNSA